VMGIGGGFILVPIMIYVLRVPTTTVIGTSMVLTLVTMLFATLLHAITNHLVDAVLALLLMVAIILLLGSAARQMLAPLAAAQQPELSLSPGALPSYALRTTMRMLAALAV